MTTERLIPVKFDQSSEFNVEFDPYDNFPVMFETQRTFDIEFMQEKTFDVNFRITYESYEQGDYPGPYTVTPTLSTQVLQTVGKTLSKNITVNATPYSRVSNEAGGYTVTIL